MKVYAGMDPRLPLAEVAAYARQVEALGFDGLHVAETVHDAFAVALLALEQTERITVRTSVALAFVRSPLLTAYAAWDLSAMSGGRFGLGLGTQIRQHIEERHGMPYGEPVPRLRDYLDAVAAAFAAFRSGEPPHHNGTYYRLTRLPAYFNPGPDDTTATPASWLGGVNPALCRLAGERAAGFVTHPTNSNPRYLETRCLPHLEAGAAAAGRTRQDIEVVAATPVITGATPAALDAMREHQRRQLGFLYSTPSYLPTLELYGWADLMPRLQDMIRSDRWDQLPALVTDEVLTELVPTAMPADLPDLLRSRYDGLVDGLQLTLPLAPPVAELVAALHAE